jgi:hypothetical protein
MWPPRLLETRPISHQWVVADFVPLIFGIIVGIVLGVSSGLYALLLIVATVGGFLGGMEHTVPHEGAARGEVGGLLFGLGLLLGHHIAGTHAKASLPSPEVIEIVITTIGGIVLGAAGAAVRGRRERGVVPVVTADPAVDELQTP